MTIRGAIRSSDPDVALDVAAEARKSTPRRAWRVPLAAKLAAALVGLVGLVLLVNGAVNTWLNYNQAKDAALEVQEEKARSAAVRVGEFLADIETQLGFTTGAEWRFAKPDQQRYDFVRLLRQVPAITELSYLDGQGKEQLKVSRLEPDSVGSGKDFSTDPRFTQAVSDKIWFGPVEFRRGSEPYMTIALAHVGKNSGVTVADVNLKLIWDVISAIRVGDKGYAFVVDGKGRLIAHPDLSLVLRDTDFSELPQVRQALDANARAEPGAAATPGPSVGAAEIATAFDGGKVLTAYAVAPRTHWIVFVQQPLSEALASVYTSLFQTLALLGLGLLLALTAGGLLARRMVVPIRRLQQGAEKLGAGDLTQRLDIHTGDEIETLADRFNQMAGRIQESYETLEAKVEARTRDLNEALQQQTATAEVLKVISGSAFDLQPVFDALVSSAVELCNARSGLICIRDGEVFRYRGSAGAGQTESLMTYLEHHPATPGRGTIAGRVMLSGRIEAIPDRLEDAEFAVPLSSLGNEARALLGVPLLRNDAVEGVLIVSRLEPGHFAPRQIEVLQTFADQAVIAIENARLFEEVQARTHELAQSLDDLRKAQDRLIQSEKLASLGQLTAGHRPRNQEPAQFCQQFLGPVARADRRASRAHRQGAARRGRPRRGARADRHGRRQPRQGRNPRQARRLDRQEHAAPFARGLRRADARQRQRDGRRGAEPRLPRRAGREAGLQGDDRKIARSGCGQRRSLRAGDDARAPEPDFQRVLRDDKARAGRAGRDLRAHPRRLDAQSGGSRRNRDSGQRNGNSRRGEGEDLQSVLHHQAGRRGHRTRPFAELRHRRQAAWRDAGGLDRAGRLHPLRHRPAARRPGPGQEWGSKLSVLVLVVDDEPDVEALFRQHFRRDLRSGRLRMEFAMSAADALAQVARASESSLILILSDINMPGMTGLEMLPKVKALRPEVPVIMITAYGDPETKRRAIEGGADGLLTKPIDFATLRGEIDRRLERTA